MQKSTCFATATRFIEHFLLAKRIQTDFSEKQPCCLCLLLTKYCTGKARKRAIFLRSATRILIAA